ncbi:hypothetical protein CSAL01_10806 [Colletotrichum salicis]|uniref:Uncharacterized protein n=1 Tax=Colletotrichum salicis TaxID=1209931 RepID=A0A135UYW3_9PEZI|nr:hypothetical protein CSAL01_10806 [Colletotrichum salicis]
MSITSDGSPVAMPSLPFLLTTNFLSNVPEVQVQLNLEQQQGIQRPKQRILALDHRIRVLKCVLSILTLPCVTRIVLVLTQRPPFRKIIRVLVPAQPHQPGRHKLPRFGLIPPIILQHAEPLRQQLLDGVDGALELEHL